MSGINFFDLVSAYDQNFFSFSPITITEADGNGRDDNDRMSAKIEGTHGAHGPFAIALFFLSFFLSFYLSL